MPEDSAAVNMVGAQTKLHIAERDVNLNSVLVVYKQDSHQDLQDLRRFVVQHVTMQYVQEVFAVVMMVNVVLVPLIALILSIVNGGLETAILQERHPVLRRSTILVRYLEVFLIVKTSRIV